MYGAMDRSSATAPFFSVIVTAYGRRQFLLEALRSVSGQTLERKSIEVIVSTNFQSDDVDTYCRRNGFRILRVDQVNAGTQIEQAVQVASGRYVALLDDDDTWRSDRLRRVQTAIKDRPLLAYYGNSHIPVDENGTVDFGPKVGSARFYRWLWNGRVDRYRGDQLNFSEIDALFQHNPGNNSSIVVPLPLLRDAAGHLRRVRSSIDHFLLVLAIANGGEILLEHLPLTVWRRHSNNWSNAAFRDFREFEERFPEVVARILEDNRDFRRTLPPGLRPDLERYIDGKIRALNQIQALLRHEEGRVAAARELARSIGSYRSKQSDGFWNQMVMRSLLLTAVSPSLARATLHVYL